MSSAADEDLAASKTDGFKVGEKKTVEEYAKLGKLSCFVRTIPWSISWSCVEDAINLLNLTFIPNSEEAAMLP